MENINFKEYLVSLQVGDKLTDSLLDKFEAMPMYEKLVKALENSCKGKE